MPFESDLPCLLSDLTNSFLYTNNLYSRDTFSNVLRNGIFIKVCQCPNVARYIKNCCKSVSVHLSKYNSIRMVINIVERRYLRRALAVDIFNASEYPCVVDHSTLFSKHLADLYVKVLSIENITPAMPSSCLSWEYELDFDQELNEIPPGWEWHRFAKRSEFEAFKLFPLAFLESGDFRMQVSLREYS